MKELNKFLVFPYENHIENILKSLEDKMYGRVEDILTLNGWWVKTKPEIHVGNKEIKIKKNIDSIMSANIRKRQATNYNTGGYPSRPLHTRDLQNISETAAYVAPIRNQIK